MLVSWVLLAAAVFGVWRTFIWLLEKCRHFPWTHIQLWVPTVTLACGWAILLPEKFGWFPSSPMLENAFTFFAVTNGPALLVAGYTAWVLLDGAPAWLQYSGGSV